MIKPKKAVGADGASAGDKCGKSAGRVGLAPDVGCLFEIYCAILSSVDWQRDVRRYETICRDSFRFACIAYNEFQKSIGDAK